MKPVALNLTFILRVIALVCMVWALGIAENWWGHGLWQEWIAAGWAVYIASDIIV